MKREGAGLVSAHLQSERAAHPPKTRGRRLVDAANNAFSIAPTCARVAGIPLQSGALPPYRPYMREGGGRSTGTRSSTGSSPLHARGWRGVRAELLRAAPIAPTCARVAGLRRTRDSQGTDRPYVREGGGNCPHLLPPQGISPLHARGWRAFVLVWDLPRNIAPTCARRGRRGRRLGRSRQVHSPSSRSGSNRPPWRQSRRRTL